ncbi:MAG: response regulator [Candidatus Eisenbacteria bacterium]|nr:response regulator [Candidatus Eisenbacteria bacterium]
MNSIAARGPCMREAGDEQASGAIMSEFRQPAIIEAALGGLLPGRSYLFHGNPGMGKTVLALQVAHAWTAVDRRVLFLTTDPPEHVLQQASLLGLSLEADWRHDRFVLCPYANEVSDQIGALGMTAFLDHLAEFASKGPDVGAIVLDPLIPLFRAYGRKDEIRHNVETLIGRWEQMGWSALLLARTDSLHRHSGLLEALRDRCWGAAELAVARGTGQPGPFVMRVERSRQASVSGGLLSYAIALETGLIPIDRAAAAKGSEPAPAPHSKRVLIASREGPWVGELVKLLSPRMRVDLAGDGAEALSLAATSMPDVILLQQDLPGISGLMVARALRDGRYTMPIICMSLGGRRRSDRIRALLHGATDFVESPFDLDVLAARIQTAGMLRLTQAAEPSGDGARLAALQGLSRGREMRKADFTEAFGTALRCSRHFASPVSVVAFRCHPGMDPGGVAVMNRLFALLETGIREGDLLCFPEPRRALVLLCHENEGGARSLARRIRRKLQDEVRAAGETHGDWQIEASTRAFDGDADGEAAPRILLEEMFEEMQVFASGTGLSLSPAATGTDGA